MIHLPSEANGLRFEKDPTTGRNLDEAMLEAVMVNAEPLPLMEHLLSQLYQKQKPRDEQAASQRDALQVQLKETEAKAQLTEKNAEQAASQGDALQAQLKETEAKAQLAEKNAELAISQRDALQAQLTDTEAKAQGAKENGEVATNQRGDFSANRPKSLSVKTGELQTRQLTAPKRPPEDNKHAKGALSRTQPGAYRR
ncbi:MAG: hypothetical protein WB586_06425 [Chthoniobacterales bacterium]